jgi:hypothetical protein
MKSRHSVKIAVFLVLAVFTATALAGGAMTVNGTITDDYLLVDDNGEIYIVNESDKGDELLENVGSRVSVTGDVEDSDDGPVIDVKGFKVISE